MNQTTSSIWAKNSEKGSRPISLATHTKHVLETFDKLKKKVNSGLQPLIQLAIVCHDWGKVLPAFQIQTLKNKDYKPNSPLINFPHSLFSILWINKDKLKEKLSSNGSDDYLEFIISAIAYHHWRENFFEVISAVSSQIDDLINGLDKQPVINELQKNLNEEIKQLGSNWKDFLKFDNEMAKGLCNGVPFYEYARPPYQLYFLPKRVGLDDKKMRDWILIAGFLQRADHFASFCEEEGLDVQTEKPEICSESFNNIQNKVTAEIRNKTTNQETKSQDSYSIWQLEKIAERKEKNIILIAPTGYGKTEFAFLWGSGDKFFYTLPLRAAVNQIYNRAVGIFGPEKSGLLHSDADIFLLGDGGESQVSLRTYDLAKQLAFPSIISTGDQFFPYALRPPGYEKIYATFSYSRLIIDEVQAYDPRAAAIVVKFIEDVVRMGGKFLLMTATLPKFIKGEIDRVIGERNYELINIYEGKEGQFKQICKHKIKVELINNRVDEEKSDFTVPEEKLKEVLDQACKGKRVLVIANTVKQAQDIFKNLEELIKRDAQYKEINDKIWLLHSLVTQADRHKVETKICGNKSENVVGEFQNPKPKSEEGKILVATQVVEASLDIDADVLFTEIAPMDALVQRMGRVLRRYGPMSSPDRIPKVTEPNIIIWVFKNGLQSGKHYVYETDLVLITLKLLKDGKEIGDGNCKEWFQEKKEKTKRKIDELISSVIDEIFSKGRNKTEINKRKSKQAKSAVSNPSNSLQNFELVCSEYDKYELVKKLYDSLPEDCNYLKKFLETKDILDAGYMSDRTEEAQKLFREIHTIPVIPSKKQKEFLEEIKKFLNKANGKTYTWFKKVVLANFVVHIPLWKMKNGERVSEWLTIQDINEDDKTKLIRWCKDIYFADYDYDSCIGLVVNSEKNSTFII